VASLPFTPDYPVEGSTFFFCAIGEAPAVAARLARSANPLDPPVINPNYLQCDADIQVLLHGIKLPPASPNSGFQ